MWLAKTLPFIDIPMAVNSPYQTKACLVSEKSSGSTTGFSVVPNKHYWLAITCVDVNPGAQIDMPSLANPHCRPRKSADVCGNKLDGGQSSICLSDVIQHRTCFIIGGEQLAKQGDSSRICQAFDHTCEECDAAWKKNQAWNAWVC